MGARPLRYIIERELEDRLAALVLKNPDEGRRCLVTAKDGELLLIDQEVFPLHKPTANV